MLGSLSRTKIALVPVSVKRNIAQFLIFQSAWFVCVFGGDVAALVTTLIVFLIHQKFFIEHSREWILIGTIFVSGLLIDSSLAVLGVLNVAQHHLLPIPLWLWCLWALFATTLNHSLSWLQLNYWRAALFAAMGGPVAYWSGSRLSLAQYSSIQLAEPVFMSLLILSGVWAGVVIYCLLLQRWIVVSHE